MADHDTELQALGPALLERVVRALGAPPLRGLARRVIALGLRHERLVPRASVWRAAREYIVQPAACCPAGGPQHRFVHRFVELCEQADGGTALGRYLRATPPEVAAARLEACIRIVVLGTVRHDLLDAWRRLTGSPPVLLLEAQIAPYPECDRDCAGCYSREDRGGAAPTAARLAWLVDEAARCGACAIHVAGKGEPLLDARRAEELCELIAARPHLLFTVATNGLAVTPALAARLGALRNLLLLVSVDGPQPVHDARRGTGTFARVQRSLALLREHDALFGWASFVAAPTARAVVDPAFVQAQAAAGCLLGVYSRYFPLAAAGVAELAMTPAALAEFRAGLARAQRAAATPLMDLDEMEAHTGCHARAGASIYIDGVTGAVAPCIRVPFAPAACRLDPERGVGLAAVLRHPFFVRFRAEKKVVPWCGADLGGELADVEAALGSYGPPPPRLAAYRERAQRGAPARDVPVTEEAER